MASSFGGASTCGLKAAAPSGFATRKQQLSLVSPALVSLPRRVRPGRRCSVRVNAAKELYFNKDGSAIKKLQTGVNKLADLVGDLELPLAQKGGIVNDGVTVAKEVLFCQEI